MVATRISHQDLADGIFDELTAVLGPLTSAHLARDLDSGDILDALHGATDEMTDGIEISG